jgi:hypothetical protein
MRPRNTDARAQLLDVLRRGPTTTAALVDQLGISTPTVNRILRELAPQLVSVGQTRQRKHALRRALRGVMTRVPMFSIDDGARAAECGSIELVEPEGCVLELDAAAWPLPRDDESWWDGLPYPVQDMRPQGYLGRIAARTVAASLRVSPNPDEWTDDDALYYLAMYGSDTPGCLVVGENAMQDFVRRRASGIETIPDRHLAARYVELAESSLAYGAAGSSAGGEFPKFTAARELAGSRTPHVIVKFSGAEQSAAVRRWSDLLVCEHVALESLAQVEGHAVARSRVLSSGGRTFLESERFDRHGEFGRSAVVTLKALQDALIGSRETQWLGIMRSPGAEGLFDADLVARAEELQWFGRFIANTDMHTGNLGFTSSGGRFVLAPAYDMLPMHYAPLRAGEVPQREFDTTALPHPARGREDRWKAILAAALDFWRAAGNDARICDAFRATCTANHEELRRWADAWRH